MNLTAFLYNLCLLSVTLGAAGTAICHKVHLSKDIYYFRLFFKNSLEI